MSVRTSVGTERHQACAGLPRGFGCIRLHIEESEGVALSVNGHVGDPLLAVLIPTDSAISRRPTATREVLTVSSLRNDSEILAAVIKPVPIDVIDLAAFGESNARQFSVQVQQSPMSLPRTAIANCIATATAITAPAPLVRPLGISGVNDGVASDDPPPPAQRNTDAAIGVGRERILGSAARGLVASSTAELASVRRPCGERSATSGAGILTGHRASPVRGVASPAATNGAGISRRNYNTVGGT